MPAGFAGAHFAGAGLFELRISFGPVTSVGPMIHPKYNQCTIQNIIGYDVGYNELFQ